MLFVFVCSLQKMLNTFEQCLKSGQLSLYFSQSHIQNAILCMAGNYLKYLIQLNVNFDFVKLRTKWIWRQFRYNFWKLIPLIITGWIECFDTQTEILQAKETAVEQKNFKSFLRNKTLISSALSLWPIQKQPDLSLSMDQY